MNPEIVEKQTLDWLFRISLSLKALGAILELAGGIAALFLTTNEVLHATTVLVQGTLAADPTDPIANYILNVAANYVPGTTNFFLFAYLAGHGMINLFLVVALLAKRLWAYPLSLGVFGAFVAYEFWQLAVTGSLLLGIFTVFDLVVIWLIGQEYGYMRAKRRR
ncbi:MAG: DUF2127 domain-containing protein [Patescibacteria group bacterium]|nr:DUF2127 domain-containing protein [Patescibacteria group bacterium]